MRISSKLSKVVSHVLLSLCPLNEVEEQHAAIAAPGINFTSIFHTSGYLWKWNSFQQTNTHSLTDFNARFMAQENEEQPSNDVPINAQSS